jgi:phosphate transport system permease protein
MSSVPIPGGISALPARAPTDWKDKAMQRRIRRRYAAERRFRLLGLFAILLSASFLAFLLFNMFANGIRGFTQTELQLRMDFARAGLVVDPAALSGTDADEALAAVDIDGAVRRAATAQYGEKGPAYLSEGAWLRVRERIKDDPSILSRTETLWIPASGALDTAAKGAAEERDEADYSRLSQAGAVKTGFNARFLSGADATDPTVAGIWGAFKGSLLTMLVTLALAFPDRRALGRLPRGICAAEPLDRHHRGVDQQSGRGAVDHLRPARPRRVPELHEPAASAPLVGGLTLALMTMPVIVIAGRNAIKSVPPSIRDAALGIGASRVQVVFHHVLPLALPGILTGTIIGMARALGETAPLLMIGMRAFIASPPGGVTDPASVLPVQSSSGRTRSAGLRREDLGGDHRFAGLPARDERTGYLSPQQIRTALVNHGPQ